MKNPFAKIENPVKNIIKSKSLQVSILLPFMPDVSLPYYRKQYVIKKMISISHWPLG